MLPCTFSSRRQFWKTTAKSRLAFSAQASHSCTGTTSCNHAYSSNSGKSASISAFGNDLVIYYSIVETVGSGFAPLVQSTFFLTSLRQAGIQIDSYMDRVCAIGPTEDVPLDLLLCNLVVHIADIREYHPTGIHVINCMNTRADTRSDSTPKNLPPTCNHSTALVSRLPAPPGRPFRIGSDTQCVCCGRWGHEPANCMQLVQTYLCMQYIAANADFWAAQSVKWKNIQSQVQRQGTIRLLRQHHPEFYADQTTIFLMVWILLLTRILSRPI
jgi:hypothetical protein